jgi:cytidylate kinase
MKKIIIAIDGFSSCGKSTLAKQLANKLQYVFVDTGAMYRAITLYFLKHAVDVENDDEINKALSQIKVGFVFVASTNKSHVTLNGIDVEQQVRGMEVSNYVSIVAALHQVRTFAVAQQQEMGKEKGIVMDGRDIGTTVFPNAELKIFVTADPAIRVARRYLELSAKNPGITKEEVQANLAMRDEIDSTRAFSPLRKAADAVVLDNTHLTREEQLKTALQWVNEKINSVTVQ